MARVVVGDVHPVNEARHDKSGFQPQLVRFTLPLRSRSCLAVSREQDCFLERLQDEDLHHLWRSPHALRRLHLALEQSVLQVKK